MSILTAVSILSLYRAAGPRFTRVHHFGMFPDHRFPFSGLYPSSVVAGLSQLQNGAFRQDDFDPMLYRH